MEAIKALLAQINTFWQGKDKRFKRNAIIIAASVLAVVILASVLLNQVDYALLYSGLDAEDSAAVIDSLNTQKVPSKVTGDAIYVPRSEADRLRMSLNKVVKNGFDLSILQQGSGLGVTDAQRMTFERYQLQSDIRNALRTCEGVRDAKVTLVMPDTSIFANSKKEDASAGVIVTFKDGFEPTADNVKAMASFVERSVPGLKPENLSMMDSTMRLLDASDDKLAETSAKDQLALKDTVRNQLQHQVMNLLQPVFGFGRVTAEVNVDLNFDDKTTDSVKFEPVVGDKEGIAVSIDRLREEIVNGSIPAATSEPGTNTNTGTGTPTYPVVNADNGTYTKNAETINYEVNSIKTSVKDAKGTVRNLSVAVVVDNTGMKDDPTAAAATVTDLVAKAVGVGKEYVAVQFMPMASAQGMDASEQASKTLAQEQQKGQQERFYIILGAVLLVVIVAMLLVFMGRKPKAKKLPEAPSAPVYAAGPAMTETAAMEEEEFESDEPGLAAIRIVRDNSAKEQIGKLIEKNPELVANLLRTWLADEQE